MTNTAPGFRFSPAEQPCNLNFTTFGRVYAYHLGDRAPFSRLPEVTFATVDFPLHQRVLNVIKELQAIQAELGQPDTDPRSGLAAPKVGVEDAQKLKATVDQLRLFLWAYLDAWSHGTADPTSRLQKIRMESAADMLRLLHDDFRLKGVPPSPESQRLAERLREMLPLLQSR